MAVKKWQYAFHNQRLQTWPSVIAESKCMYTGVSLLPLCSAGVTTSYNACVITSAVHVGLAYCH